MPRGRLAVAVCLWLVLVALVGGLSWLLLLGCGVAMPGSGRPLMAFCSAEAMSHDGELLELKAEQEALETELRNLERDVAAIPACGTDVACGLTDEDAVVDIYFLQDLSSSFDDDLPNVRRMIDDLLDRKESGELGPNVAIGLGSFIDKPVGPQEIQAGDYAFKAHASLHDTPEMLRRAARELVTGFGGESSDEAQFEAIVEMLGAGDSVGFRDEARKYVVVVTDAGALQQGDYPAGVPEDGMADGDPLNEDYPSAEMVSELLHEHDVIPVFLVTGGAVERFYQAFVDAHGVGHIGIITATSDNLTEAILTSLASVCDV